MANSLSSHMSLLGWLASPSLASPDSARVAEVVEGQVPAGVDFPTAADWQAQDIGMLALAIVEDA